MYTWRVLKESGATQRRVMRLRKVERSRKDGSVPEKLAGFRGEDV